MDASQVPVVVGAGQLRSNRAGTLEQVREPLALILEALGRAASPEVLRTADAVYTVGVASWDYDELSARVAAGVGATPRHRVDTGIGGHLPVRLLEGAAARIAAGDSQVAIVVGGEAEQSMTVLRKAGIDPQEALGWTPRGTPAPFLRRDYGGPEQVAAGLLVPTRVYPLFENRLQADLGQTPQEAAAWSAQIYSAYASVAAENDTAWAPGPRSAADIATVTATNRMICEPYPLAVNANPRTDQAAAVVLMSLAAARAAGVREDSLTYVWGGVGVDDTADILRRRSFGSSDALTACLRRTRALSPVEPDLVDVYSCFPVVPKLAVGALGLPRDAVLSVAGGHSSFGGPLSSYSLHAVATMHQRLRPGGRGGGASVGLVHANGGYLTYQHAVLLGARPHPDGWVGDPTPTRLGPIGVVAPARPTNVVIETLTVEHGRDGTPERAFLIGHDANGGRVVAMTPDRAMAERLSLSALPPGVTTHVGRRARLGLRKGVARINELL